MCTKLEPMSNSLFGSALERTPRYRAGFPHWQRADFALPPGPEGAIIVLVVSVALASITLSLGFTGMSQAIDGFLEDNAGKKIAGLGLTFAAIGFLIFGKPFRD
mgnify:CR=1 FL=1